MLATSLPYQPLLLFRKKRVVGHFSGGSHLFWWEIERNKRNQRNQKRNSFWGESEIKEYQKEFLPKRKEPEGKEGNSFWEGPKKRNKKNNAQPSGRDIPRSMSYQS
jgi:hypothetical protein